ncbi:MAG: folylpolyglutamate synthase/dihydrofolate synthase family protein [Chthoniobacteraceae bacterium]|jgi:dihydrofolate synthase/folylpolyglutamate synthase
MTYAEALAWLYGTQNYGIKLGLDRVRTFLSDLGWEGGGRWLHVAGTNGKGSVCAMLDSICRAAGMRTGLYTSPHLVTFRERIRMNGEMAPEERIAEELTRIRAVCERSESHPTFFEITTALALLLFQRAGMDVVALETGMGGRLDATNLVQPAVAVITSVGLDHTQYLGGTLAEIAFEKAGIIKPGVPVVTGPLPEEAAVVVRKIAAERGAALTQVSEPVWDYAVSLKGAHQRVNAAMALRALEAAGMQIAPEHLAEGLRTVSWPARFQDTGRGFVLDGAHNPDAARRLAQTWRGEYGDRRAEVILGIVRDKDARGICAELAAIAEKFTIVPVRSPRAGPVEAVLEIARSFRPSRECATLDEAIATTPRGQIPGLITGSFFLMGEALVALGLAGGEREISAQ